MDYENIAKQILQHIGGKENVVTVIHCMTRLRFTLKNEAVANDEAVKSIGKPVNLHGSVVDS